MRSRAERRAARDEWYGVVECRWGGEATAACWNPGACGCQPDSAGFAWREAQSEQFSRSWWALMDAIAEALYFDRIFDWLARILAPTCTPNPTNEEM